MALWLATDTSDVNLTGLAQYGVLGVVAALLIVFARSHVKLQTDRAEAAYKREVERADRLETENVRLNTRIQEQIIPALVTATAAIQHSAELLRELQRERELDWRRHRDGSISG